MKAAFVLYTCLAVVLGSVHGAPTEIAKQTTHVARAGADNIEIVDRLIDAATLLKTKMQNEDFQLLSAKDLNGRDLVHTILNGDNLNQDISGPTDSAGLSVLEARQLGAGALFDLLIMATNEILQAVGVGPLKREDHQTGVTAGNDL
ncbi:hypothetical protein K474DRAFT_973171 [Panus rudis PR-1116 ss-1]|nr:hypothetical protein K474DRAFT_973171 [Panus rudis PR-1116 ss-1]